MTRARAQASVLTEQLMALGANVIEAATIKTEALELSEADIRVVEHLEDYKYIIFTSAEGVS